MQKPRSVFLNGRAIAQINEHFLQRLRPVTDLHLIRDGSLAERAAERLVIKERIVAETAASARMHAPAIRRTTMGNRCRGNTRLILYQI